MAAACLPQGWLPGQEWSPKEEEEEVILEGASKELPRLLGRSRCDAKASEKRESGLKASSSKGTLLEEAARKAASELGDELLGVKVRIDSMEIEPLHGTIELHGLTVDNPEGFKSAYLLHADKVFLHLDMLKLITSLGSTIDIDEIDMENVDVIYEETLTTSNIHTVIKKAPEVSQEAGGDDEGLALALHTVRLRGLGAQVLAPLATKPGPRLALGDVEYEDGSAGAAGAREATEVAQLAIASLLERLLPSISRRRGGAAGGRSARGAGRLQLGAGGWCCGETARRREEDEEVLVEPMVQQVGDYPLYLRL